MICRTRALQGLRAKEIHLCGALEVVNLVKSLVESCGDEFELRQYERLSELRYTNLSTSFFFLKLSFIL